MGIIGGGILPGEYGEGAGAGVSYQDVALTYASVSAMTVSADSPFGIYVKILQTQPSTLLGYWPCDDVSWATNNRVTDVSGLANHLTTQTGTPTFGVAGQRGNAIQFNGTSGRIALEVTSPATVCGEVITQAATAGWTMFGLIRPDSLGTSSYLMSLGWKNDANIKNHIIFGTGATTSTRFRFLMRDGAVVPNIILDNDAGTSIWANTTWGAYALRWDPGNDRFNLRTAGATTNSSANASFGSVTGAICDGLYLGGLRAGTGFSAFTACTIQHVAMWNTQLSDAEVDAIAAQAGL